MRLARLISTLLLLAPVHIAAAQGAIDSTYSSEALRAMVAAVATANHEPPESLHGYQSHIETESSLIVRDTLGREHSAEVEQFATQATWKRNGPYSLHVVGYRSQSVGVKVFSNRMFPHQVARTPRSMSRCDSARSIAGGAASSTK